SRSSARTARRGRSRTRTVPCPGDIASADTVPLPFSMNLGPRRARRRNHAASGGRRRGPERLRSMTDAVQRPTAEHGMVVDESSNATMRTVRFHEYGEPVEVLRLDRIAVPSPPPGRIRVVVHGCGLNPADRALCRGLFPGALPRGIGLELSGVVDAVGEGVEDVAAGDLVTGTADYAGAPAPAHRIARSWTTGRASRRGSPPAGGRPADGGRDGPPDPREPPRRGPPPPDGTPRPDDPRP